MRRKTRNVLVGNVWIGSDHPISIQSMTNIPIEDINGSVKQIINLCENGCEIIRLSVPKPSNVAHFEKIKGQLRASGIKIPLVADVHFSSKIAYDCLRIADKVRINAGNFAGQSERATGSFETFRKLTMAKFSDFFKSAKSAKIPIRVGINAGSLSKRILSKFGATAKGIWESAHECIIAAESVGYEDLIFSFKSSNVRVMAESYQLACSKMHEFGFDYPLHLGLTEAGNQQYARIKSAISIGSLLLEGIGDTVRVSLTEDPVNEIFVARDILQAVCARQFYPEFIACPSCGRTSYDIQSVFSAVKGEIGKMECGKSLKIAVMGCVVNGLGEARDADYAIVGLPNGTVNVYKKAECVFSNVDPYSAISILKELILRLN